MTGHATITNDDTIPAGTTAAAPFHRGELNQAARRRGLRLATRAFHHLQEERPAQALRFIERAIDHDQLGALDEGYYTVRAIACERLGYRLPGAALERYNEACKLKAQGDFNLAASAFHDAYRRDPRLLWALNNLAWQLSTSPVRQLRNGLAARDFALVVCRLSNWHCWAFVGTLAAALAECGLYDDAVRVVRDALDIAPPDRYAELAEELDCYQYGCAYVEQNRRVAAGEEPGRPQGTVLQ